MVHLEIKVFSIQVQLFLGLTKRNLQLRICYMMDHEDIDPDSSSSSSASTYSSSA
jgi:hypothetical protein